MQIVEAVQEWSREINSEDADSGRNLPKPETAERLRLKDPVISLVNTAELFKALL